MGNFRAVLDGDIQGFLDAVLRWRAGQPVEVSAQAADSVKIRMELFLLKSVVR